ncbi:cysteine hydrolase [Leptolyngbya sp. FACHB-671]|uniref:cysteine hydrolase family protein n=1 Tax=Leptolyngbya sp. FACHB-671 TaxID=2692812 RepID=UPI00168900B1|nr:cysteine hydrolase family protein [Leptolyngbya sp. FACHB-671]MBD2069970.1 cysteine hydrolase [Leptolyngbya sp. FACHB-671]
MQGANVKGLILVDIQNDYFPGGNWELVGVEQAVKNAQKLLQKFREEGSPIFHIQHISVEPEATFFLPNTKGAETHESVASQPNETVIMKHFPNSFRETSLLDNLKDSEVEEVVICGAMSHMCIDATTRAAFDFGLQCIVIEDACATRDLEYKNRTVKAAEVHSAFMGALAEGYAKVIATDEFSNI